MQLRKLITIYPYRRPLRRWDKSCTITILIGTQRNINNRHWLLIVTRPCKMSRHNEATAFSNSKTKEIKPYNLKQCARKHNSKSCKLYQQQYEKLNRRQRKNTSLKSHIHDFWPNTFVMILFITPIVYSEGNSKIQKTRHSRGDTEYWQIKNV